MSKSQRVLLFLSRISIGWILLYAGISKLNNPAWSAAGYIKNAKSLPQFYQWLASPGILPITNFLNEWGMTLLGVALILGIFIRLSVVLGALMMVLLYIPILVFPKVGPNAFIIDEHIIYALLLLLLAAFKAGQVWGLENWIGNRLPFLRKLM